MTKNKETIIDLIMGLFLSMYFLLAILVSATSKKAGIYFAGGIFSGITYYMTTRLNGFKISSYLITALVFGLVFFALIVVTFENFMTIQF